MKRLMQFPRNPRSPNGNDVGTQYRSGIYFYTPDQEKAALESRDRHQKLLNMKIVTEILPAKKFYRAEEYHQQHLAKGGRFGFRQSAEKGHHICFSVSNFDSFVQSLKEKGIEVHEKAQPDGKTKQAFFFDLDGNGLEVSSQSPVQ
ncbi:unnamed protein product [Fraxinus pennsylvanica]|uniref:peptide-methionine (S)-S-oxide reductase n=1 Tax=Fraxinus pennsylvanica TaxID=56036 RepID=A0AAD1ZQV7_9LAMI|nr:unnamed protein product [Fraxinus pennsylvanica]